MASARAWHGRQHIGLCPDSMVGTKIFTLVYPLEKSRQSPESIFAHKNTSRKIHHLELQIDILK